MKYFVYRCIKPTKEGISAIVAISSYLITSDILVPQYEGEGQEYKDQKEAFQKALKILEKWKEKIKSNVILEIYN